MNFEHGDGDDDYLPNGNESFAANGQAGPGNHTRNRTVFPNHTWNRTLESYCAPASNLNRTWNRTLLRNRTWNRTLESYLKA